MMTKSSRAVLASAAAFTMALIPPTTRAFVLPVHDPINGVQLIAAVAKQVQQIQNQATQIKNQVDQVKQGATNLAGYSGFGQWANLATRLQNLQAVVNNAAARHVIAGNVADTQIAQMNQEITTLHGLERLADGSAGALQAQSASARLEAELVTQLQEQRQLSLAQIKQQQLAEQEALKLYHGTPTRPDSY